MVNTRGFNLSDTVNNAIDINTLTDEIAGSSITPNLDGITRDNTACIAHFDGSIDADTATFDTVIGNHDTDDLALFKAQLDDLVDIHAFQRFQDKLTFTYDSKEFSLSKSAQLKIRHYDRCKSMITYPKKFITKDNTDKSSIADETAMSNFHQDMATAFITEMDLIQDTKDNINTAVDATAAQTAADAYLDL